MAATGSGQRGRVALWLMLASGFAGLGYQVVWTQQSAVWLGNETAAVLAVVAAFFAGLATGAMALAKRMHTSARPERLYAACELVIAAWSLVLALSGDRFGSLMLHVTGAQPTPLWQWSVAFGGTFLSLLPATAAMGATLPAMQRALTPLEGDGHAVAALYASNTFGAVIGVLASAFWLVPAIGLTRTALICASANVLCALLALRVLRGAPRARVPAHSPSAAAARRVLMQLAVTGLLGIGFETLVVRVLSQLAEDTVYTFALLLAVYLVSSAAGAAGYYRWLASRDASPIDEPLLCATAAACVLGIASLWLGDTVKSGALAMLPPGMAAALASEALLAIMAFALPSLTMGMLFSHLATRAGATGVTLGRALGANMLGAAVAPLAFGVLALPAMGAKLALLLVPTGYLVLAAQRALRAPVLWAPATAVALLAVAAPRIAFVHVPDGGRIVSYADGVAATVSVVENSQGVAVLRINNRQQEGSSATRHVDGRQGLLPLLLHPEPHRALFLGLGTGVTAWSAALDPQMQIEAVELLPEVAAASSYFTAPLAAEVASAPRVHIADARRYVRADRGHYDVIVADNFHPARSGSAQLYTVEHFEAVRARLGAHGLFCQWLPLHQLDLATLRSIVRSYMVTFPQAWALLANNSLDTPVLGLVARADGARLSAGALRARLAKSAPAATLTQLGIDDEFALLGSFVAGPQALRRFAGASPLNTDDLPVVAYLAPRITYAPQSSPRERLLELLRALSITPDELMASGDSAHWMQRLTAYWSARDRFIETGSSVRPRADVRAMLAQVRVPLLSILATSPDFRPAYDPLLLMARTLASSDVDGARALLTELQRVQPARPEAGEVLEEIAGL